MKVLFLLNGLTHYFIPILNRLNNSGKMQIIAVVPESVSVTIGQGIYQTLDGIDFKIYHRKEILKFYRKRFFNDFWEIVKNENPNVIVFIWPYILELVFNPFLLIKLKIKNIKIIYREIPFQLQPFYDAMSFKAFRFINENNEIKGITVKDRLNNFFVAIIRKLYYSFIDLHLHYIEDGYSILNTYGVSANKIVVTYNSPDTDQLIEAKKKSLNIRNILPANPFRLIHVGRLVKWKRVDLLIEAIAKLSKSFSNIELIVIGNGPELNNLKFLTQKLNVQDRVSFVGPIYDPVLLGRYFNSSSIYVLAGMGGLSINEAMVFEKPVICSVCDGTEKALVKDDFNGYFFMSGDVNSLVEKLNNLLLDKNKIELFGKNSFDIIKNKINIKIVIEKYLNALLSLKNN